MNENYRPTLKTYIYKPLTREMWDELLVLLKDRKVEDNVRFPILPFSFDHDSFKRSCIKSFNDTYKR